MSPKRRSNRQKRCPKTLENFVTEFQSSSFEDSSSKRKAKDSCDSESDLESEMGKMEKTTIG